MKTTNKPTQSNAAPEIRLIDLDMIHQSAINPRTEFDEDYIQNQLAPSIKANGIMQPLVVRSHPELPNRFEIIIGECRYRAACSLNLPSAPCIIRTATDLEAQKMALAENLQRKDLSPVEEGRAFKRLLEEGATIAELAKDFGLKRSAIYGRIKLTELCKLAIDALAAGKLTPSVALRIARIPGTEQQISCTRYILGNAYCQTDKAAAQLISTRYMTELKGAPFDRTDATLNPERGCCDRCTFRTGNQGDLWNGEMKGRADICTDPACFKAKITTAQERKLEAHRDAGGIILDGNEASNIIHYGYLRDDNYLDLNAPHPDNTLQAHGTLRELIGTALKPKDHILAIDSTQGNKVWSLITRKSLDTLVKSKKVTLPEPERRAEPQPEPEWKIKQREQDRKRAILNAILPEVCDGIGSARPDLHKERALMHLLLLALTDPEAYDFDDIIARREIDTLPQGSTQHPFEKYCKHLAFTEQLGLLAEIVISQSILADGHRLATAIAEIYDIDTTEATATAASATSEQEE